ncbi:hypothetical protein [Magnetovibrio sp.]|uniref:hypothetical protein n=1 Tax=Magnetovibrio sp. TaxID=2024836 RepID=UPI002F955E3D
MHDKNDEAMRHPLIVDFVDLVDSSTTDGIPTFSLIETRPFIKFWKHFIIHKWIEGQQDFLTVFYGSHICEIYQRDCTGLLMSEMGFGEALNSVKAMNKEALDSKKRIYATNSLYWKDEKHKVFHQVKMPLRRNHDINEVLVCMTFD